MFTCMSSGDGVRSAGPSPGIWSNPMFGFSARTGPVFVGEQVRFLSHLLTQFSELPSGNIAKRAAIPHLVQWSSHWSAHFYEILIAMMYIYHFETRAREFPCLSLGGLEVNDFAGAVTALEAAWVGVGRWVKALKLGYFQGPTVNLP